MFSSTNLIFLDFETKSDFDLAAVGTYAYAATASAIVCAFAIGDAPAQSWHADGAILDWDHAPPDLRVAFEHEATFAAWNASFDAAVWNYSTLGFPFLVPERIIDPMVQAGVANLPMDLESASRRLGGPGKQPDGKKLIQLFCVEGAAPAEHPEKWQRFLTYARTDVEEMRDVYRRTRPLPLEEWRQYWAFEHVNRRGVAVDLPFVRRAAALAAEDAIAIGRRLAELTNGAATRVTQAKRLAAWLHDQLTDAAMREVLTVGVSAEDDGDEDDDDQAEPHELSLKRDRVARVLAMLDTKRANGGLDPAETTAHEVATLRLYGAGASPKKFARLEAQQVDGVLRGQYRFAGAGQTGRLTSRGAQIQNLVRDVLGEDGVAEAPLVDAIADGCSYAALAAAEPVDVPPARKLALLVRPALVAGAGKLFVWSDWSAIEARGTPWIAASEGAEKVLDIFRANDRDPSRPDIYTIAAADILHKDPYAVTKTERGVGKVVILACIAEGELVLTDAGLVPIEKVTTAMRVWDGVTWVSHTGVVCRGVKDVITYDGLTATADHVVFTTQGELQFGDVATRGAYLIQSGPDGAPPAQRLAHDRRTVCVFDIVNAGPRHRFTVSGRLVSNCGFGGSVGALKAMALAYRINLDEAEARRIVDAWREANPWAREFWGAHRDGESFGLWGAAMRAWEAPGEITTAGRIAFVYRDDYLGGALFMALPSGRLLTYPRPKWRDVNILNKDGKPTGEQRRELSFRRAHGRAKLWHGTFCENSVQAVAADLLRATVMRIENDPALAFMPIRMTTHDEIVCEVAEARAEEAKAILRCEMLTVPDWAAGLPLQSEESSCPYYSKSKAALKRK
jgi:DNA polymerase bacteriophage-type